ncbi:hypothetical protein DZC72_03145 [Maribacter algicola]|uniref:Uncharacterized protein n=2 Tax=Maribacter algicola TaxID=2498892 RepID=A0A426RKX8_9FLAO|nr:hypothetical protein DZC72_03145 [Maribacter algicola]
MGNYIFIKTEDMENLFDVSTSEHEKKLIQKYLEMSKTMRKSLTDWGTELKNHVNNSGENGSERKWY